MRQLDDESIDMIFCDLPYGVTRNKWDSVIHTDALWQQYERVIKPNGAILLFGQDKFTAQMMLSNSKLHRYNIIWNKELKSGFLNAKRMPLRQHEDIMVFYKKQPVYNPQMVKGEPCHGVGRAAGQKRSQESGNNRNYGDFICIPRDSDLKYPSSIWTFQKPHPSVAIHPTEKPVELCRYAIRTYSNEGDIILDNCCGSGSIPLAAVLERRNFIAMDNGTCEKGKPEYQGRLWADITNDRVASITT